jgi:hypothetical protein
MLIKRLIISKLIISAGALAVFASIPAMTSSAQTADERTYFSFSGPVELPGVMLPAGNYMFRFVDASTGRRVMQVVSNDGSNKTYGLFMTISAQRPTPPEGAELRFMETPSGAPPAIKTWWYPGSTIGREFIYPKGEARRLAAATHQTVLTTRAESETNDRMKTTALSRVSPGGQEAQVTDETRPISAMPSGTGQPGNINSGSVSSSAAMKADADRTPAETGQQAANTRTHLPRTDTLLPLIGLIGLGSLAGSASLRFFR